MIDTDFIKVTQIKIERNKIIVDFLVSDRIKVFFKDLSFWAEYTEDISKTPKSMAIIPFVCNVLPIIWVTDSNLIIDEIDSVFYNSISKIKKGYIDMYPKLKFGGDITFKNVIDNSSNKTSDSKVACLFSGGIDAFATLFAHIEEKPRLITIWGADVNLKDTESWSIAERHIKETAYNCNLDAPTIVKSNFSDFINQIECNHLVSSIGYNYWYALQHGIGLLSLCAPIAFMCNISVIYIAGSFTIKEKGVIPCASDPSIDNNVCFANTKVWHDQYDKNRQQKVNLITSYCSMHQMNIQLRTCYKSNAKGGNCCKCEKCLRSMYGILAEGYNPNDYGFNVDRDHLNNVTNHFKRKIFWESKYVKLMWTDIKNRFIETQSFKDDNTINWIYNYDFMRQPALIDLANHYLNAFKYRIKKLFSFVK